ncbi:MAG: hypothetical protein SF182_21415 [Deltaproteobacteria bacterium]|nr:hypothetical protein [Deltaproteobacteria bacterium]
MRAAPFASRPASFDDVPVLGRLIAASARSPSGADSGAAQIETGLGTAR